MAVPLYGDAGAVHAIAAGCSDRGTLLIEDAAQGPGNPYAV